MRENDAVLFDYGGVLTNPVKHSIADWLAADAIKPESFSHTSHAAIYGLALDRLGVPADRVLFIDDAEPNALGARTAGLQALLHVDHPSTRAALAQLVPDLNPHP